MAWRIPQPPALANLWTQHRSWLTPLAALALLFLLGRGLVIFGVGLLSAAGYREFARATGLFRERFLSAAIASGIALLTLAAAGRNPGFFMALSVLGSPALAAAGLQGNRPPGYLQRVALSVVAFMLFGVSLGHLGLLANDAPGSLLILVAIGCAAASDVCDRASRMLLARAQLHPLISAHRALLEVSGATLCTAVLFAFFVQIFARGTPLDQSAKLLVLGVFVSLAGRAGTLVVARLHSELGGSGQIASRVDWFPWLGRLIFVGPVLFTFTHL